MPLVYPFFTFTIPVCMEKLYYSIGEVADELKVPQSTLRFWETQFTDMPSFLSRKNDKGTRRYSKQNLENCRSLLYLLKEKGMTIEGAKKTLKARGSRNNGADGEMPSDNMSVVERLISIRNELQGLVDVYDDIIKGKSADSDEVL